MEEIREFASFRRDAAFGMNGQLTSQRVVFAREERTMTERRQKTASMQRETFLRNPQAALERAENSGPVVVKNKDGSVHSVLSVPRDVRPTGEK
jgi:hypothetical protein